MLTCEELRRALQRMVQLWGSVQVGFVYDRAGGVVDIYYYIEA